MKFNHCFLIARFTDNATSINSTKKKKNKRVHGSKDHQSHYNLNSHLAIVFGIIFQTDVAAFRRDGSQSKMEIAVAVAVSHIKDRSGPFAWPRQTQLAPEKRAMNPFVRPFDRTSDCPLLDFLMCFPPGKIGPVTTTRNSYRIYINHPINNLIVLLVLFANSNYRVYHLSTD